MPAALPEVPSDLPLPSSEQLDLSAAAALCRTGDLWLFRGTSAADNLIRLTTNSPVNHVGMVIAPDDLPAMMWHAELGRSLPDLWSGATARGAQLHDLTDAVTVWATRYGQRAWLRQLQPLANREMEDAALRTVARLDGTPFPTTAGLAASWLKGRTRRSGRHRADILETAYCAEIVAATYISMGLLRSDRSPSWYDPGRFWSGDSLPLLLGAQLGREISVCIPAAPMPAPPTAV